MNLQPDNILLKDSRLEDMTLDGSINSTIGSSNNNTIKYTSPLSPSMLASLNANNLTQPQDIELQNRFFLNDFNNILLKFANLFQQIDLLPTTTRLVIGCTLFRIGRFETALREVSTAIENDINEEERGACLHVLASMLKDSSRMEDAVGCLGEMIDLWKRRLDTQKDFDELKALIMSAQEDIEKKIFDIPGIPKLEVQLMELERMKLRFPIDSFTGQCQFILSKINEAHSLLIEWDNDHQLEFDRGENDDDDGNPLSLIQDAFLLLGPIEIYNSVLEFESVLINYLCHIKRSSDTHQQPTIVRSPSVKRAMARFLYKKQVEPISDRHENLLLHCTFIEGFLAMLHHDYILAANNFETVLNKFDSIHHHGTSSKTLFSKNINILLIRCKLNLEPNGNNKKQLERLLSDLANLPSYQKCNNSYKVYIEMAIIHSRLAKIDAVPITITFPNKKTNRTITGLRLQSRYVQEALKANISAVTAMYEDDQYIPTIYDKILIEILTIGGIHCNTFMFFRRLRDYFARKADYQYLYIPKSKSIIDYENIGNIMNYISQQYNFFKPKLENTTGGRNEFLLPQIYITNENELYILEKQYFASGPGTTEFYCDGDCEDNDWGGYEYHIYPVKKSNMKLPISYYQQRVELSIGLIEQWITCYKEFHNCIPDEIQLWYDQFVGGI
ncbi:uncharacterized protein J8A68_004520 [[Candida] subhashii]|uniref:Uncharacterized protein n=1 Tax=[Candida] subhashii TaxID=561895 RepID=A0A8J5QFC3_9ASCO|nr:uncharacterized protein J8A68_004520 [[Candida] subhashii]KAG7661917.1 hypothetical protein J8A68_004520 [[Candida] subhashii]